MKNIKIFDSVISAKDYFCSSNKDSMVICEDPALRLYIKMTDSCSSNCAFCANRLSSDFGEIDVDKLLYVINYLYESNLLSSISFTGGEPLLKIDKLLTIIDKIYDIDPLIDIQISSSGYNLRELANYDKVNNLESIHISHHHYNEDINRKIFNSNLVANADDIMYLQDKLEDKKIININTLVMKGYIDSLKEIEKNLDYVDRLGVYKNGFVSLIKCNNFCNERYIDTNDIFNSLNKRFIKAHNYHDKEYCECIDGLYLTSNNNLIEYYVRMNKNIVCPYTTQLVYTSDNRLTKGFGKDEIEIKGYTLKRKR